MSVILAVTLDGVAVVGASAFSLVDPWAAKMSMGLYQSVSPSKPKASAVLYSQV